MEKSDVVKMDIETWIERMDPYSKKMNQEKEVNENGYRIRSSYSSVNFDKKEWGKLASSGHPFWTMMLYKNEMAYVLQYNNGYIYVRFRLDKNHHLYEYGVYSLAKLKDGYITHILDDEIKRYYPNDYEKIVLALDFLTEHVIEKSINRLEFVTGLKKLERIESGNTFRHLDNLSTKKLLGYLESARNCGGSYNPFYDSGYTPKWAKSYSIEEIKSVLAKREHIPNKAEAKRIRQEKHKMKNNR